jgi:hypothetical protein
MATRKLNLYRQIDTLLNIQARERERTAQGKLYHQSDPINRCLYVFKI